MMSFASAADAWSRLALAVTWQLAALAAVALLGEWLLRLRAPRVRHALWWFVLLAPLFLAPGRAMLQGQHAMISVRAPKAAMQMVTRHTTLVPLPSPGAVATIHPAPASAPVAAPPTAAWRTVDVMALVWLFGTLVLALRLAVGHRQVRRLLLTSRPIEADAPREMLAALLARAGMRDSVSLRITTESGSPVLYGWRSPVIVAPQEWVESLTTEELRAMLAHEVAHVKRRDFLANSVQRLIELPLFFHPAAWLAGRRIALAREELCDAWALNLGADPADYARCLTAAVERAQSGLAPVSLGLAESKSVLRQRVEAIVRRSRVTRISRPLLVSGIAICVLAAGAFGAVQLRAEGPAPKPAARTQQEQLAQLRAVSDDLREIAGAVLRYVQDTGGQFPPTQDMGEIRKLLAPYLTSQRAFGHDIRYVLPAGLRVGAIEVPAATPMLVMEGLPSYTVTAYADGQVDDRPKEPSPEGARPESEQRVVDFTVVLEDGDPAASARIELVGGGGKPVTTDAQGLRRVLLTRATAEAAFYIVSDDGHQDALPSLFFTGPRASKKVTLHPIGSRADTVRFSGRVMDAAGRPVAGAELWMRGFVEQLREQQETFVSRELGKSGPDGRFSFTVPRLAVGHGGFISGWIDPWQCEVLVHKAGYAASWARREGAPEVTGLEIVLGEPGGVRGHIVDAEGKLLPSVPVAIRRISPSGAGKGSTLNIGDFFSAAPAWTVARTDARGSFSFTDLPLGGKVELDITTCGAGESYREDEMAPDLGAVTISKRPAELTVKLARQPVIEGVLFAPGQGKKPAEGVKVMLTGRLQRDAYTTFSDTSVTDQKGRYQFRLSEPGTWTLAVADTRYAAVIARDLKVGLGQHIVLPPTVLDSSGVIRGRVLDAVTGDPVPNVLVMCHSLGASALDFPPTTEVGATSGRDGRFQVGAPAGKVNLYYGGPPQGYTWYGKVSRTVVDGEAGAKVTEDPGKPERRVLTVKPGQQLAGMDLFVTREPEVTGVVLGPDGRPWQPRGFDRGGYVRGDLDHRVVKSQSWPPLGHRVEQDGTFSIRYCYPGVPTVLVVLDEKAGLGGGVRFVPELGKPTHVTIRLAPVGTLTGRLLLPDGKPAARASVAEVGGMTTQADSDGRFSMRRGIIGLPLQVTASWPAYSPARPNERPTHHGTSAWFQLSPGEKTRDVGDITLTPLT